MIEEKHKASFCEERILHKLSKSMHNSNNNNHHFKIEEHRRKVVHMLAQSMTEADMFFISNCLNGIPKKDDNAPNLIAV